MEAMDSGFSRAFTGLSEEELQILGQADRFARKELYPLARRMDDEEWWPADVFQKIGQARLLGVTAPEALGGSDAGIFAAGLILEAFSRWNHGIAISWVAHENLCLNNILRNGSAEQRRRYLPGLCDGSRVGALGLTEPGAGSDALGSMRTRARRDGDDYVLNGTKTFITNGPVADVLLVYARTDPERGVHGISAFIVERSFPGFRVAQKFRKMGFRGSPTGELVFEDCRVPAANRVGPENQGVKVVMSGLDLERAMVSPMCLGIAERALELSIEHARQRRQFGRAIGEFQMVEARLADMYTTVEAMRLFAYQVLRVATLVGAEGGGRGEVHRLTAAGALFVAEGLNRVLDSALQIHGGNGYMWETEINRLYRAIKLLEIGAGTSEVRRTIVAHELLRG